MSHIRRGSERIWRKTKEESPEVRPYIGKYKGVNGRGTQVEEGRMAEVVKTTWYNINLESKKTVMQS